MQYICSIKATRAIGYGSPQMQEVVTNGLMQLLPMLNEEGRNNVLRRRAALLVGQANVDSVVPPYGATSMPGNDEWDATVENNDLREPGGEARVTDQQNHVIHFGIHMKEIQDNMQAMQAGQVDLPQLLLLLEQTGPHMNDQVKKMRDAIVGLAKATDMIKQQMQQAAEAQAKQQMQQQQAQQQAQPDPAALAKVVGDLKLKSMKQEGDMQLKTVKQAQQMKLKDLQAAHSMGLKTATTAQDQALSAAASQPEPEMAGIP